jgi:dihydrofolate synthase/folylpolyglutamate synthase
VLDVRFPKKLIEQIRIPLAGGHQTANASLAATASCLALRHFAPKGERNKAIRDGLASVRINARMEMMGKSPRILLDGAHNAFEAGCLARAIHLHWLSPLAMKRPSSRGIPPNVHMVVGILADKDQGAMARAFASIADSVVVTQPPLAERTAGPERIIQGFRKRLSDDAIVYEPSPDRALDLALARASSDDIVLVTGSMFLAGALRERWVPEEQILERRSAALIPPSETSV